MTTEPWQVNGPNRMVSALEQDEANERMNVGKNNETRENAI